MSQEPNIKIDENPGTDSLGRQAVISAKSHESTQKTVLDELDATPSSAHSGQKNARNPELELVGKVLANKYEILELVGKGGMSVVYKAKHTGMGKIFAVKLLHLHLADDEISQKRFKQEAQASSNLNHPGIVSVHDYGEDFHNMPYLVMDYIEGPSLSEILKESGNLSLERFLSIMQQVTSALAHAHASGIVHRDLKPSNIMITRAEGKEQAKIVDFGIAKVLSQSNEGAQQLTQTGEIFGSPLYMSPEQCSGSIIDQRTDIYALGCVMYEALSGKLPHKGNTVIETMHKHVNEQPPPLVAPQIPDADRQKIELMLLKCLAKLPEDRFQNTVEIESELHQLKMRSGTGVLSKLAGAWDLASAKRRAGKKTKLPIVLGALAACMLSVFILLFGLYQADQKLHELARIRKIVDSIGATESAFLNLGEAVREYFAAMMFHPERVNAARKFYIRHSKHVIEKITIVDKLLKKEKLITKNDRLLWRKQLERVPRAVEPLNTFSDSVASGDESQFSPNAVNLFNELSLVSRQSAAVMQEMTLRAHQLENRALEEFARTEQTVVLYSFICIVINGTVMLALSLNFVRGNPDLKKLADQASKLSRRKSAGAEGDIDDVEELNNVLQELANALSEAEEREKALLSKIKEQDKPLDQTGSLSSKHTAQKLQAFAEKSKAAMEAGKSNATDESQATTETVAVLQLDNDDGTLPVLMPPIDKNN